MLIHMLGESVLRKQFAVKYHLTLFTDNHLSHSGRNITPPKSIILQNRVTLHSLMSYPASHMLVSRDSG